MSRISKLPKMWQRPGMYLFDYAQTDGASMYAAFIHAIYEMSDVNHSTKVRFQSLGEYHVMIAKNYQIQLNSIGVSDVPSNLDGEPSLIDWLSNRGVASAYQPEKPLQSCIGLANIVSFTEFCTLDMSVANEHFRQLFYLGQAASPCERRRKTDLPALAPYISLWFTLHPAVFKSRTVRIEEIESALQGLKKYVPKEFQLTSKEHYDYGFAMTIEVGNTLAERLKRSPEKVLAAAMAS